MAIKVGSAPDSWGVWFSEDAKQIPWPRFLDEIEQAGYKWTELGPYGYLPADPETLRRELGRRGLQASAVFVMVHLEDADIWPELERQIITLGEQAVALGIRYLVLIDDTYSNLFNGEAMRPSKLDPAGWRCLVEHTNKAAKLARERFGLTLVFHPHAETHIEYEDQIEKFLRDTDPHLVHLCLDTGHHAYRGGDTAAFMRKHHRRIPYLHIKSVDAALQKKVEEENIPFAVAVGMNMLCEPSRGVVDFRHFLTVLQEIGYDGFAVVEQDMYPVAFDVPLPIAKRTRQYLLQIGFG